MRVITRPDFDGVVCAALLMDALCIRSAVRWVQPADMQQRRVVVRQGDVIANLPFHHNCSLWFDHHYSNRPKGPIQGAFRIAPSAAGIIYDYYRQRLDRDYAELVRQTDRIDSADLTLDEIVSPQHNPYLLLSMTLADQSPSEAPYWDHLVTLLRTRFIEQVMQDPTVQRQCQQVLAANRVYEQALRRHTSRAGRVSITDFRDLDPAPLGNRFLVYSIFPDCTVNVKIVNVAGNLAGIHVGRSIVNRGCVVNVGKMLSAFGGGGHPGAGACRVAREEASDYLARITAILQNNAADD